MTTQKIENLKAKISELESFRVSEIKTTGFVSGRTWNKLAKAKKQLISLES